MADFLTFSVPLTETPDTIPDAPQRAQALDVTRSFIVEAPAGSGKTGLIIQRFLKLLASDTVSDPAQVLAITFTRKATHEMRDRVLEQLAAAHSSLPPANGFDRATRPLAEAALARDRLLGWRLLEHPARLNISTIDAFCTQIAHSLPVLSGTGGQTPAEDARELYAEAARRTLNLLGGHDEALTHALKTLLLHRDANLADCETLIATMLHWRDQWGSLVPLTGQQLTDSFLETVTLPRLERALEQAICRALTRLDKLMPPPLCHELAQLARQMSQSDGYQGAASPLALCRELKSAPGTAAVDLEHWRALAHLAIAPSSHEWRKPRGLTPKNLRLDLSPHHKAQLIDLLASLGEVPGLRDALCSLTTLPPLKYPPEQWIVAKSLFRILSRALVELQFVFAARGQCDFTQFSLVARDALRGEAALDDLAASTGFNLEHLLIDEMQDTSTSQYELIRLLTQRWDGGSQTIFLVGDPKQSIYLFRQARVARFIDTLRAARLGDLPLTPLFLTANFRSQGNLVNAFNETFAAVFPTSADAADSETVPFRPAAAIRAATAGPSPDIVWHTNPIPHSPDDRPQLHQAQLQQNAQSIRRLVETWRARPLPSGRVSPWHIAVLVRNRKHLLEIVQAFKREPAIPFRAVKTEPLAQRQEVLDLLALTRALLHPADRTAWLALLRTPWCGLTLRDLHLLAGPNLDRQDDIAFRDRSILEVIRERGDLLSEDGLSRLQPFFTVMSAALASTGRLPLSHLVERTWRAFAADAFATPEELANIQRFLQLLDELEAGPALPSISQLQEKINALYAAESTHPNAVDLMTIHHAKGLEWDFVVVPELESGSGVTSARLLSWLEIEEGNLDDPDAAHGIIAPVQPRGRQSLALNKWMRSIESSREVAERKRLFYVASTRAREELHLFAAPDRKRDGGISRKPDSLLAAAWPAAEPHFQAHPEESATEDPGFLLDIAAAGLALVRPATALERTLQRIPLDAFLPSSLTPSEKPGAPQLALSLSKGLASEIWAFPRPEGSFAARALGNATHTFLDLLANRIASGTNPAALLSELPTWSPRISAVLRAGGLAREDIARAASTLVRGLTHTLEDPSGRWILSPHPEAASESALVTAAGTLRLDRTFLAGPTPLDHAGTDPAATHLWIVDFKTATHGTEDLDAFLARERARYAPQLESYAAQLASRGLPIRLALYFPLIPRLIWWPNM